MKRLFITFSLLAYFSPLQRAQKIFLTVHDIGYGEYLVGECVTCHSQTGVDKGIPSINGLDAEVFASVMHAYKAGDIQRSDANGCWSS